MVFSPRNIIGWKKTREIDVYDAVLVANCWGGAD